MKVFLERNNLEIFDIEDCKTEYNKEVEIPQETLCVWKKAIEKFNHIQQEMRRLYFKPPEIIEKTEKQ